MSEVIDKWALFEKLGYTPHSQEQRSLHESTARYQTPCCGRRFGKSIWAGHEMTAALFEPEGWYWIVGPDYSLAEKEFRVVYNDVVNKLKLGNKCRRLNYNVRAGDMVIQMPWGTILEVKSAENQKSLVGEGLNGVIMSEAAKHKRETWERFIQPALTDRKGWAKFPSTPEGYNWYYAMYLLGQLDEHEDYMSWRRPSWDNPIVYPGGRDDPELKKIEATVSPSYFAQEYGAEFTSFEGQIYDEFDDKYHVKRIEYNPFWKNGLVFDFGFAAPFVALDIMIDPEENVYVWREYQKSGLSTWDHGHYLRQREQPEGYHVDFMYGDPRGADAIATLQLVLGPVLARPVPRETGYEWVKRWLKLQPNGEPKLFIDKGCTELIRQMKGLRRPHHKDDLNPKEGQLDYDDHGPDALRYFFNEFFILGAVGRLADVYGEGYKGSEADSFFTATTQITLDSSF